MADTKKTILLVDDDADFLMQEEIALKAGGYDVLTADSGKRAEEIIARTRPDAAIVDVMMEDTDAGFMLCYHIKKKDPSIPVIMVTSVTGETGLDFDAATDEEKSWIKADAFLAKPIRIEQLEAELTRLLKDKT
ncbi:MAG TPA: response regulator [Phycisphaerae bacterium]|nr:response regulator [Phycisphaerae bacterium]HRR83879.1 response regulator [Phycisphaerae bacterium]